MSAFLAWLCGYLMSKSSDCNKINVSAVGTNAIVQHIRHEQFMMLLCVICIIFLVTIFFTFIHTFKKGVLYR